MEDFLIFNVVDFVNHGTVSKGNSNIGAPGWLNQ